MKMLYKNIIWAIATLLVVAIAFSAVSGSFVKPTPLTLDELVIKISEQEVSKIIVAGESLEIELKGGEKAVTRKEAGLGLSETLKNYGVEASQLGGISLEIKDESGFKFWAKILIPSLLPILIILFVFWLVFKNAKQGASQAFSFGKANIRLFSPKKKDKITFKDVAGLEEAKQELQEVVQFLKHPKKFLDMGAKIPRGVLLMGSPGTGKTLLARAVAGEGNVPFFSISASEFVEMFVGVGASRTRDAFTTAKKASPAILFIDEIDAIGRQRGTGLGGGNDEREQTLNQILVELDGFERDTQVIVLAATNRPDVLDKALLRPGRFDRQVVLDLPDIRDRQAILKIHMQDKPVEENIDVKKIAIRTPGFSGADLANLVNEAAILAARNDKKVVSEQDFLESVEKVLLGPERRSRVITDKERKITAYHEAGHALVAASLEGSDPVHKVSIISRGFAGGYTLKLPIEETNLKTRSQFLTDLATMMGGYAAEEIIFGEMSTGASNDLKQASSLARKLVTKYGMSEKLGPIAYGEGNDMVFLGRDIASDKNYSEDVAAKIDAEVKSFITHAHETAKKVLEDRKEVLQAITDALLQKEVLEQEEFYGILEPFQLNKLAV
ncbi:TPA: cell division protein FtsH [Patescibacteria group bacterium]|nr:cell division protein FtsH [Patescibacteria group bacterium]|tara:strand:+ start:1752 stop:3590 length:1839 start_codon:yes stop_codon:yes gene_type:complete